MVGSVAVTGGRELASRAFEITCQLVHRRTGRRALAHFGFEALHLALESHGIRMTGRIGRARARELGARDAQALSCRQHASANLGGYHRLRLHLAYLLFDERALL